MLAVKCPMCKTFKYNKIWLLLFANKNDQVCPNCNTKLEWNKRSMQASYILMLFAGVLSSRIINGLMKKGILRELTWVATFICLILLILSFIPRLTYPKDC